jgi:hypothetical protein
VHMPCLTRALLPPAPSTSGRGRYKPDLHNFQAVLEAGAAQGLRSQQPLARGTLNIGAPGAAAARLC